MKRIYIITLLHIVSLTSMHADKTMDSNPVIYIVNGVFFRETPSELKFINNTWLIRIATPENVEAIGFQTDSLEFTDEILKK